MSTKLNLVVAACNNRGIGKDGKLPWRIRKDMEFFKQITSKTIDPEKRNAVVMGRKTWFSIPEKFRPLPNRINIILSKTMSKQAEGIYVAQSLEEAVAMVTGNGELARKVENVHIIGGSSVYQAALESEYPCKIYLTRILADYDCDTYLPEFDKSVVKVDTCQEVPEGIMTEKNIDFMFEVYEKCVNQTNGVVNISRPFNVMAAMCYGRGIGYKGNISWPRIKADYAYYMNKTSFLECKEKKCVSIQGRKTWESTGVEQKQRESVFNIVVSKQPSEAVKNDPYAHKVVSSFEEALSFLSTDGMYNKFENIWVMGGEEIFKTALKHPNCKRVYLTQIQGEYPSDSFLPEFEDKFHEIADPTVKSDVQSENGVQFVFKVFEKN